MPGTQTIISNRRGFTLVELLVVISIVSILAALLLPSLRRVKERANNLACCMNLRQIALSINLYADDNDGVFPYMTNNGFGGLGWQDWLTLTKSYRNNSQKVLRCPSDRNPILTANSYGMAYLGAGATYNPGAQQWGGTQIEMRSGKARIHYVDQATGQLLSTGPSNVGDPDGTTTNPLNPLIYENYGSQVVYITTPNAIEFTSTSAAVRHNLRMNMITPSLAVRSVDLSGSNWKMRYCMFDSATYDPSQSWNRPYGIAPEFPYEKSQLMSAGSLQE